MEYNQNKELLEVCIISIFHFVKVVIVGRLRVF